jgi:hypothetical protein
MAVRNYTRAELAALEAAPPPEQFISWWQWRANQINNIFTDHGARGKKGFGASEANITAATVRHGQISR